MSSDQTPNLDSGNNAGTDPLEEARDLIERLLEERMTPAEAARFETLARNHREVRRLYLQTMNMVSNLPHYLAPHDWILEAESPVVPDAPKPSMEETMELPALAEGDWAEEEPPALRLPDMPRTPPPVLTSWWRRGAAAAAIVAVASVSSWLLSTNHDANDTAVNSPTTKPIAARPTVKPPIVPPPVMEAPKLVHLTGTAGVTWPGGVGVKPGSILDPGQGVSILSGAVEVVFATGTRMVVEGPASFRVVDFNHAELQYGKLVARVPPAGRGFGVHFGERVITDLGTEFGLETSTQQRAAVSVFEGKVVLDQATPSRPASTQPSTLPSAPLLLTQGQVVVAADAQQAWAAAPDTSVRFARTLADVRLPIPKLPSTGVGLKDGDRDPHWQLYQQSAGEASIKPAVMTTTGPPSPTFWAANDPTRSQWLSTAGGLPGAWPGAWVFRTTIDLTGFDPATAVVQADLMVDDAVTDVRINGVSTKLSVPMQTDRQNWRQFHRLNLQGFKEGVNTIDLVTLNGDPSPGLSTSKMGLRAELHGDAVPLTVR